MRSGPVGLRPKPPRRPDARSSQVRLRRFHDVGDVLAVVWASIVRSGPTATLPDAAFGVTHALEAAVVSPRANRTGRDATVRPPHNDDSDIGFRRLVVGTPKQAGRGAQG